MLLNIEEDHNEEDLEKEVQEETEILKEIRVIEKERDEMIGTLQNIKDIWISMTIKISRFKNQKVCQIKKFH